MGLLDSIARAGTNIWKTGQSAYASVVSAGTKAVATAIGKPNLASTKEEILKDPVQKVLGTMATGVAGALAVAVGKTTKVGQSVVSALAPKTVKGKLWTGVGALTLLQTEKGTQALANAPEGIISTSSNLAGFIQNPSTESFKKIYVDNPIVAGTITGLGLFGLGKTLAGGVGLALNTLATRENTEATRENSLGGDNKNDTPSFIPDKPNKDNSEKPVINNYYYPESTKSPTLPASTKPLVTDETGAILPQTTNISTTRRRRSIKKISPISNRINVNIQNNNNSAYRKVYKRSVT